MKFSYLKLLAAFTLFVLLVFSTNLVSAQTPTPIINTSFEDAVKTSKNTYNFSFSHWFEFGDYDGGTNGDGARTFLAGNKAHTGTKSIGLEVSDITKSRRSEFNILDMQNKVGDEGTISVWMFFPANYGLHAPNIDWNWHEFFTLYSEYNAQTFPHDHYLRLTIVQPDITKSVFNLTLGGRRPTEVGVTGTKFDLGEVKNFALPRGKWFEVRTYLKRHETQGVVKVWIDGKLVFNFSGIKTKQANAYQAQPGKVYYETTDTTVHQLWVDDLKVYAGYVEPTSPAASLTPTNTPTKTPNPSLTPVITSTIAPSQACDADIDLNSFVDLTDYTILVSNFFKEVPTNPRADIDKDGFVDLKDYSILVANFFKSC